MASAVTSCLVTYYMLDYVSKSSIFKQNKANALSCVKVDALDGEKDDVSGNSKDNTSGNLKADAPGSSKATVEVKCDKGRAEESSDLNQSNNLVGVLTLFIASNVWIKNSSHLPSYGPIFNVGSLDTAEKLFKELCHDEDRVVSKTINGSTIKLANDRKLSCRLSPRQVNYALTTHVEAFHVIAQHGNIRSYFPVDPSSLRNLLQKYSLLSQCQNTVLVTERICTDEDRQILWEAVKMLASDHSASQSRDAFNALIEAVETPYYETVPTPRCIAVFTRQKWFATPDSAQNDEDDF